MVEYRESAIYPGVFWRTSFDNTLSSSTISVDIMVPKDINEDKEKEIMRHYQEKVDKMVNGLREKWP